MHTPTDGTGNLSQPSETVGQRLQRGFPDITTSFRNSSIFLDVRIDSKSLLFRLEATT